MTAADVLAARGPAVRHTRAPRVVELVGPAGAGKTTLAHALARRDARFVPGPALWDRPWWDLVRSAAEVAPILPAAAVRPRLPRPRMLAQMIRLGALRRAVDRLPDDRAEVYLVDEGPLFGLAWLDLYCGQRDPWYQRWRKGALRDWRDRLFAVIRLDAPDEELARRIRSRAQPHRIKHTSDPEITAFTARYRRAFDRTLDELGGEGRVTVLDLRTDQGRASEAVVCAHQALEAALHGR